MNQKAWTNYFETGDRDHLVRAYWKSIWVIAGDYPKQREDMFQVGMLGLLKAIEKLDVSRVKSLDAWIFLNVRSMMMNVKKLPLTASLYQEIAEDQTLLDILAYEPDFDREIDVKDILVASTTVEEVRDGFETGGYLPSVERKRDKYVNRYHDGQLSLRGLAQELGISRRQACKLVDKLPASW